MCILLHEMMTLLLRFCRNIIKYDKTSQNPDESATKNVPTSSRNDGPFVRFVSGISYNMIKHPKIQTELATRMYIHFHEMMTLSLVFFRNIIKYDKTFENPK
jgi:hypothetical protein